MACITAEAEINLKPYEIANLLRAELDIEDDVKPKEIVVLANKVLGRDGGDASVKEELMAARAVVRSLPAEKWTDIKAKGASTEELLDRLLAKPASAGGFAAAVACKCLSPKNIDTRSVISKGVSSIDGFQVLRGAGSFNSLDHEMTCIQKLFKTERPAEKIGDVTFKVEERTQPSPGQILMTAKASKCEARFVALLTPKWLLLGMYQFAGGASEAETLQLFETLRLEALSK
jgi:hypothetical protein